MCVVCGSGLHALKARVTVGWSWRRSLSVGPLRFNFSVPALACRWASVGRVSPWGLAAHTSMLVRAAFGTPGGSTVRLPVPRPVRLVNSQLSPRPSRPLRVHRPSAGPGSPR